MVHVVRLPPPNTFAYTCPELRDNKNATAAFSPIGNPRLPSWKGLYAFNSSVFHNADPIRTK